MQNWSKSCLKASGGFTLLGDPAQAIYGFSDANDVEPESLINWVCIHKWPNELEKKELTYNHRSTGKVEELTSKARQLVLGEGSDDKVELSLRQMLGTLPKIGSGKTGSGCSEIVEF